MATANPRFAREPLLSARRWSADLASAESRGCTSNAVPITARISDVVLGGLTPTRSAESTGAADLATLADQRPKYLLLATDGLPNCDPANPSQKADDSAGAEQAVADALAAGFPTFVIGIGETMAETTLNQLAISGGVPQTGAATSYYQVGDTAELVAALGRILGSISCVFELPDPTGSLESTDNISVLVNGAVLARDTSHVNGWDYTTGTMQIQLFGSSCDALKAAKVTDVRVQFVCPM